MTVARPAHSTNARKAISTRTGVKSTKANDSRRLNGIVSCTACTNAMSLEEFMEKTRMSKLTKRKKKKAIRHAHWTTFRPPDIFGIDDDSWKTKVAFACSNCGNVAPVVKGHENEMNVRKWTLLKKKFPYCRCRMDEHINFKWKRRLKCYWWI